MTIPINDQVAFFNLQIYEHEQNRMQYVNTAMQMHFKNKSAHYGKIWGVDDKRFSLIIRFAKGFAPRMEYTMPGFMFQNVPDPVNYQNWEFTYGAFRTNYAKAMSDMTPVFYLKSEDPQFVYVGFNNLDISFYENVKMVLAKNFKPSIVLAEKDPPIQYLINLRSFIQSFKTDPIINMNISKPLSDWKPENLLEKNNKKNAIISSLETQDIVVIQGPPGTGKSYLIAEISDYFLKNNQSVCITALTNKALVEVAEKPVLSSWLGNHFIYKTNLTLNEIKIIPKLQRTSEITIGKGNLLLTTYYKLSDWYKLKENLTYKGDYHVYDLLIIEEASQCFLTTIAAFRKLAKKILIVGDPMQLSPIVLNEKQAVNIHHLILKYAKGLEVYAPNFIGKSYRLIETHRLNSELAKNTGLFYENMLISVAKNDKAIRVSNKYEYLMRESINKIGFIPLVTDGVKPLKAIDFIVAFVQDFKTNQPDISIAILAPYKITVGILQERISETLGDYKNVTIETIDRIQGLTVDFSIYLLALSNPTFAMDVNRFNVATSRARYGTLIVTDSAYSQFMGIDSRVTNFMNQLPVVNIR